MFEKAFPSMVYGCLLSPLVGLVCMTTDLQRNPSSECSLLIKEFCVLAHHLRFKVLPTPIYPKYIHTQTNIYFPLTADSVLRIVFFPGLLRARTRLPRCLQFGTVLQSVDLAAWQSSLAAYGMPSVFFLDCWSGMQSGEHREGTVTNSEESIWRPLGSVWTPLYSPSMQSSLVWAGGGCCVSSCKAKHPEGSWQGHLGL